jgi:hypothetical protein
MRIIRMRNAVDVTVARKREGGGGRDGRRE